MTLGESEIYNNDAIIKNGDFLKSATTAARQRNNGRYKYYVSMAKQRRAGLENHMTRCLAASAVKGTRRNRLGNYG